MTGSGPADATVTVGTALVGLLAEHGVDTIFGIPGVHTLELFRGVDRYGLRHVLSRHEQGAMFAADGYARVTGRPGVALLIPGPGVSNAATPLAQAYHDSIPLLTISVLAPPAQLAGRLHGLPDQGALTAQLTAWNEHVADAAELPRALARAFELFCSGRPRPVNVELPAALLSEPAPAWEVMPPTAQRPQPDADVVAEAAGLLAGAQRPAILLGGGAVDAGPQAAALAERLGAPIALTLNAKGTVPDAHPLSLGTSLPTAATMDALREADVVLAVGTELCDVDYYYAPDVLRVDGRLIRVDIDATQLQSALPATIGLHADAADALAALHDALGERAAAAITAAGPARATEIRSRIAWWERGRPLLELVEAVGAALPDDAIVVADSTQLAYIGQNVWPAQRARSWLIPAGWGTLGPALPMAIGAAVGAPGRPVVAVVGDGGLLFTIGEMAAAADLALPLVVLLWNNGGYGEMRDEMDLLGIRHVGTSASAHDYVAIARGFGWGARRLGSHDEVGEALTDALAAGRPRLIEIPA